MNKQSYAIAINYFKRKVQPRLNKLKVPESTTMVMRNKGPHVGIYAGTTWVAWLKPYEQELMAAIGVDYND